MSGITRKQVEAASDEVEYMNYRDARDGNESMREVRAYFGKAAAELEARYQAELADRKAKSAPEEMQGTLSADEIVRVGRP